MRVISGRAKGHRLTAPRSNRVRPALDKVKEAIFNILCDVTDEKVLDLFAGCGSVGIEALSRGAALVVFVEEWGPAVNAIKKNLAHCKLTDGARVMKSAVSGAIRKLDSNGQLFDLIFVDPPYEKNLVNPTLKLIANSSIIHENSLIVVEHHPKEPIIEHPSLTLTDSRKYGQTRISFLKRS